MAFLTKSILRYVDLTVSESYSIVKTKQTAEGRKREGSTLIEK